MNVESSPYIDALIFGPNANIPLIDGVSYLAPPFAMRAYRDRNVNRAAAYNNRDDDNYTRGIGVARAEPSFGNGVYTRERTTERIMISRQRSGS